MYTNHGLESVLFFLVGTWKKKKKTFRHGKSHTIIVMFFKTFFLCGGPNENSLLYFLPLVLKKSIPTFVWHTKFYCSRFLASLHQFNQAWFWRFGNFYSSLVNFNKINTNTNYYKYKHCTYLTISKELILKT